MKQKLNRDWEIVRIFLILGLMTLGLVLILQGIILTPSSRPRTADHNALESELSSTEPYTDAAALGRIGILPGALNRSLSKPSIFLKPDQVE